MAHQGHQQERERWCQDQAHSPQTPWQRLHPPACMALAGLMQGPGTGPRWAGFSPFHLWPTVQRDRQAWALPPTWAKTPCVALGGKARLDP